MATITLSSIDVANNGSSNLQEFDFSITSSEDLYGPLPTFNNVGNEQVNVLTQDSNYLYVGGNFDSPSSDIVKINKVTGEVVVSFNVGTGFNGAVSALALDSANNILYVGGTFTSYNGASGKNRLIALSTIDGSIVTAFNTGTGFNNVNGINSLALDSANNILYVGGTFSSYNGTSGKNNIIALSTIDGSIVTAFNTGTGFNGPVYALTLDSANNRLYIGGNFDVYNGASGKLRLIALSTIDGSIVTAFNTGTGFNAPATAFALDSTNNRLYVGGSFTSYNGTSGKNNIIALSTIDGSIVTAFNTGTGFNNAVRSLALDSANNRLYVGGYFTSYNEMSGGIDRAALLDLNGNKVDLGSGFSFVHNYGGTTVSSLSLDNSHNKIYMGGRFSQFNSASALFVVRLNIADNSFVSTIDSDSDFTLVNSTITNLTFAGSSGTFTLTPTNAGATSVKLNANTTVDSFNNSNSDSNLYSFTALDNSNPTIGDPTLTASSILTTSLTLNWNGASDNYPGDLEYTAYYSTNSALDSISEVESNGTIIGSPQLNISSINATGLSEETTYYFNVVVEDSSGNKAVYTKLQQATLSEPLYAWTQDLNLDTKTWQGVACNSDGSIVAGIEFGNPNIFISTNSGQTFNPFSMGGTGLLRNIAMSSNGQKILVNDQADDNIYLSTNGGTSFVPTSTNDAHSTYGISMSPSGLYHAYIALSQDLKVSQDDGLSYQTYSASAKGVACSNGGLLYVITETDILKSTNYGSSLVSVHSFGSEGKLIRCSDDGQVIFAIVGTQSLISLNGGTSFTTSALPSDVTSALNSFNNASITVSGNGTKLAIGAGESASTNLYIANTASTPLWTAELYNKPFSNTSTMGGFIAYSSNASKLYAVAQGEYLWKGQGPITVIDENNSTVSTPTTWGDGATLDITVPATVESGATLTLNVPSIAALTGAGSITVNPGASVSITGPTGTRTVTVQEGTILKISTEGA